MNQAIAVGRRIDAIELERLCDWPQGSITPIAWLMLQEGSTGKELDIIAKFLEVSNDDLLSIIEATTQKKELEALEAWKEAIIILKTANKLNVNAIQVGWDSIEAMAVDKLHRSLLNQRSDDPEEMLKVATAANRAMRRARGEGGSASGATISIGPDGAVDATLKDGNLGFIRLRISPAIASQIQDPNRIIDGKINKPDSTKDKEMLSLKDARQAIDEDEKNAHDRTVHREDVTRQNQANRDAMNDVINKMFKKGKYKNV